MRVCCNLHPIGADQLRWQVAMAVGDVVVFAYRLLLHVVEDDWTGGGYFQVRSDHLLGPHRCDGAFLTLHFPCFGGKRAVIPQYYS